MTYRRRNIVIASGLALLAVVFMVLYAHRGGSAGDVGRGVASVLFASHDIQEGTPGSSLQKGAFVRKRVPRSAVVPGHISTPKAVAGQVATQETLAGEQVTIRKFGPMAATGVRSRIQRYERVVQLAGDKNEVLDGTLRAGDRVDVLGSWTPVGCQNCRVSSVIVRNALVLATSAELGSTSRAQDAYPVQLRLSDEEANAVFWMMKNGAWWLMLRPVVKPRNSSLSYGTASDILRSLKRRGLIR
jgi:Flp pilus assembly protein CpaB